MGLTEITPTFTGKIICSMEEYHRAAAVGSTSLRTLIDKSPEHYLHERENPSESTATQIFRSAIHQAILEPLEFKRHMAVKPVFTGYTKKGELTTSENCTEVREKSDQWLIENHGKTIVTQEQFTQVQGILNSLSKRKQASRLLAHGVSEESYFWKDPETGIYLKTRPDRLRDGHIVIDVKTTLDASYRSFQKDLANFNYHVQSAMQLDGVSEVMGQTYDTHITILVEVEEPFGVRCIPLGMRSIQEGKESYYAALKILKKCQDTGIYPGYPDELTPMDIPEWAFKGDL